MKNISYTIDFSSKNERIDKILANKCKELKYDISRENIKKLIVNNCLMINNKTLNDSSYKVSENDKINLKLQLENANELVANDIPLNIIYEDDDLVVINKQSGLTTHPGAGNMQFTLANALLNKYGNNLSKIGGSLRPGILHRLDKNTSGLMIVAKNDFSHEILSSELQNRILKRKYLAFLWGVLKPKKGDIENYIKRSETNRLKMEITNDINNGKYALTHYKTLETFLNDSLSMVEFELETGRTHQIRIHASDKGCPLIGDTLYGGHSKHLKKKYSIKDYIDNFPRQALHSYFLEFIHPRTKKLQQFKIELANDLQDLYKVCKN